MFVTERELVEDLDLRAGELSRLEQTGLIRPLDLGEAAAREVIYETERLSRLRSARDLLRDRKAAEAVLEALAREDRKGEYLSQGRMPPVYDDGGRDSYD